MNVEIVQAMYDAWERGERPGPAELLDPEIEYVNLTGAVEPATRRGLADFVRAVEKAYEGWDMWKVPELPPELLPSDWPGTRATMLFDRLHETLAVGANRFFDAVFEGRPDRR